MAEEKKEELIPMDEIRKMYQSGQLVPVPVDNTQNLSNTMDAQFNEYMSSDEVQKDMSKQNKKRYKLFSKRKRGVEDDVSATQKYQTAFDREEWYYKRHKDTIDKYIKKDDKPADKKQKDGTTIVVEQQAEEVLRVGLWKMALIVFFDLFVDVLSKIVFLPFHLLRFLVELFYKMKKAIAVTVIIIAVVILVTVGLIFGINALQNLVQSAS